jgi:low affinity Fe/Cu permease
MEDPSRGGPLERLSKRATHAAGSSVAFALALGTIAVWIATGPIFHYSDTWQLVINTGTTVITFLMVFLIQRSQNKDSQAVHLKLNELIAAHEGTSNRLVDVEDLSEKELETLHAFYAELSKRAKKEGRITASHSIDQIEKVHKRKKRHAPKG